MVRLTSLLFFLLVCLHPLDVVGAPVAIDESVPAVGWQDEPHNEPLGQEVRLSAVSQEANKRALSEPQPALLMEDSILQIKGVKPEAQQVNRLYFSSFIEGDQNSQVTLALSSDAPPKIRTTLPDLIVTEMNGPLTARVGQQAQVSISVLNQGDASAGAFRLGVFLSTNSTISLADQYIGWCSVDSGLLTGESFRCAGGITIPADTAPGTYFLGAYADSGQEVAEKSEVNNGRATDAPVTIILDLPDLIVTEINAPLTGIVGEPIQVSASILNQGDAPAAAFRLTYFLSTDSTISLADRDTGSWCSVASGLPTGESYTCNGEIIIPADTAPGSYFLGAYVDSRQEVAEESEVNNGRATDVLLAITVELPDLTVTDINGPLTGIAGKTIQVSTAVVNQGKARAGIFRLTFLLSIDNTISLADQDTEWGCTLDSGLLVGDSYTCYGDIVIPADTAPGTYFLGAYADSGEEVAEKSEVNNGRATDVPLAITVELPDLIVTDINGPLTGIAGETIRVSTAVLNQGDAPATEFRLTFLLSTDNTISMADQDTEWGCTIDSGLGIGESDTCSGDIVIPADTSSGTYFLGAYADSRQEVAEKSEANNGLATDVPLSITADKSSDELFNDSFESQQGSNRTMEFR